MSAGATRFKCALTRDGEPECARYARVTVADLGGETARGCPEHVVGALFGTRGVRVDWDDSLGLNQHERAALQLAEERSLLL
ncbi:MAG: hypothetical protein ACXVBO_22715 [Isosphaeraceae bacterium]